MKQKILLGLLMLTIIVFQGFESLSQNKIDKSADLHVRKRRIIDISHNKNETFLRQEVPYVVLVLNQKLEPYCTGIILGPRMILTAAHCVVNRHVSIATGGRFDANKQIHNVVNKFIYENYDRIRNTNDLAMLIIDEPIDLIHSFHRRIELYEGQLPSNSHGLVTGWGCTRRGPRQKPVQPLSILVQILTKEQCQEAFGHLVRVSIKEICTHSVNRTKCCWFGDSGAPLVVSGHLVGVFSCFAENSEPRFPDVFMNLMYPEYRKWIEDWTNHVHNHYAK